MELNNTCPEEAIKIMCIANEYLFKNHMLKDGFELKTQQQLAINDKQYDLLKFKKNRIIGKDIETDLYFDITSFYGKNTVILPKHLDTPPANKSLPLSKFVMMSDDFFDLCKKELGIELRDYSLTFKQYSSEMVGGHVANLWIEDKTILVSPIRKYYEKEIPILHGYYMMRMMIDHQVQHLMDSFDAIKTETPFRSDYYKPVIGIDCVHFNPLPDYSYANDLINFTLYSHQPEAFKQHNEIRAFMASLQVGYSYNLFTTNELMQSVTCAKLDVNLLKILSEAIATANG